MSGLSKLEKLMYSIGVIDKATGPVNKIMGKINQLSAQAGNAQNQMMKGFVGAAGGAMMLVGSLNPAIAANQSLGEVKSLGVAEQSLQQLNNTSIDFTAKYGGNAANVISASYDIQSSIAGLTGDELSSFTNASAIMAKGTKSDASTATNYLGTMYGIYQNNAKDMGKTQWVEQLAGQTASAVRMFKTNGNEMSGAFTSLGAGAQSHGIEMAESMAVLGQLQSTMSGSEAGTKYKAFLAGVGNAQKLLGVELTDNYGKLLPMPAVLDNLYSKFGLIDTVAKSDALKKAFGSDEAVGLIKLLLPQVDQLKNNINDLNQQTSMQTAIDMANAQTDAWQRLSGGFSAAGTTLGQAVLPIIEPVVEVLGYMLRGVVWLSREFPFLTGVLATTVVGITGLIIAMGIMNMAIGFSKFGMIGLTGTTGLLTKAISLYSSAMNVSTLALSRFQITAAFSGGYLGAFRALMMGAIRSVWTFNAALLANPITWVVAAAVGLAVVIYKYWEPIKAFMAGFWQGFITGFAPVIDVFSTLSTELSFIGDLFSWLGDTVSSIAKWFGELLTPVNASNEALLSATNTGERFGETLGHAFNIIMTPLKAWISLITKGINLVKSATGWVSSLFGDDTDINANKAIQHSIEHLPSNVIPFDALNSTNQHHTPTNFVEQQRGQTGQATSNVVHLQNKALNAQNEYINVMSSNDSLLNSTNQHHTPTNFVEQQRGQTGQATSNVVHLQNEALNAQNEQRKETKKYSDISNVQIKKSNIATQLSNSLTNVKTENKKSVHIDSLTMKSDNIEKDFEQLMELAG